MVSLPNFLYNMLIKQYGENLANKIINGYLDRPLTLRINTLKTNVNNIKKELADKGILYREVPFYEAALIIDNLNESDVKNLSIYNNGEIYLQSLSSMIPPFILNPQENENILDMTAAPGGKTTQMVAISSDKALITACEKNKIRADRLKFNIEKQGATRVNVLVQDSRKLDDYFLFDKILLDAPCSGSGTLNINNQKQIQLFNEDLIKRSEKIQFELLNKAIKILKKNGDLIYSTCSVLKNENEENLLKLIKNKKIEIVPINEEIFKDIPLLPVTIKGTICICPNELYEGFFIAKIRKLS